MVMPRTLKEAAIIASVSQESPILECNLLGEGIRLLVDSGSRVTIAQPHVYAKLRDQITKMNTKEIKPRQRLISATGQELKVITGKELPLTIQGTQIMIPLLFSEEPIGVYCDGILGCDTLMKFGIDIIKGRMLRIGPNMIPLENEETVIACLGEKYGLKVSKTRPHGMKLQTKPQWQRLQSKQIQETKTGRTGLNHTNHERVEPTHISKGSGEARRNEQHKEKIAAYVKERREIPAKSFAVVKIKVRENMELEKGETVICEPCSTGNPNVFTGCTIVEPNSEMCAVQMMNMNDYPVTLPKGQVIGSIERCYSPTGEGKREQQKNKVARLTDPQIRVRKILEAVKIDKEGLSKEQYNEFLEIIQEFHPTFRLPGDPHGHCDYVKHRIETRDAAPVNRAPYRCPQALKAELKRQIDEMEEEGVIEPSTSSWGAGVIMVEKKDGGHRIVVDYRGLNAVTTKFNWPMPIISDVLDNLGQAKVFSVMDLASGYYQIELDPRDKEKTAFNTPWKKMQFLRLPQGAQNSPATFSCLMETVFKDMKGEELLIYMDDLIIFSDTIDEHMKKLRKVLSKLRAANLKLKPTKCEMFKREVEYLGHLITAEGLKPQKKKIEAIEKFPVPTNVKELMTFLGLSSFYRKYVKMYSEHARPLYALLKGNKKGKPAKDAAPWKWGKEQQDAFDYLRTCLITEPVLKNPDYTKRFTVKTDASGYCIGAELSQPDEKGNMHPVAYLSRQMNTAEMNYSTIEQELLAVVYALNQFRCHLYGREFTLLTDHRPLKYLMTMKGNQSSRLMRWCLKLQDYSFTIDYLQGKKNMVADCLSRIKIDKGKIIEENVLAVQAEEATPDLMPYIDEATIRREQLEDGGITKLKEQKERGYEIIDDLLYKTYETEKEELLSPRNKRLVIPRSMQHQIMRAYHETPFSGHLGYDKVVDKICKRYYWTGLRNDVKKYCESCIVCQQRNKSGRTFRAPLYPLTEVTRPYQRISMDVLCNLPCTYDNNKHLLVVTDAFSHYIEAFPMQDQTAETIARILVNNIFCKHGMCNELLTDKGSNFLSRLFKSICDHFHIRKVNTTSWHPMSNGQTERGNRSILNMLSAFVNERQANWDHYIDQVTFALNVSKHRSTNETPFFLMHGRDAILPVDQLIVDRIKPVYSYDDYKEVVVNQLETTFEHVKEYARKTYLARKAQYDKKAGEIKFRVGMKVWYRYPVVKTGTTKKLARLYKGPYRIIRSYPKANFEIKEINTNKTMRVHANALKEHKETYVPFEKTRLVREKEKVKPRVQEADEWLRQWVDYDYGDKDQGKEISRESNEEATEEIISEEVAPESIGTDKETEHEETIKDPGEEENILPSPEEESRNEENSATGPHEQGTNEPELQEKEPSESGGEDAMMELYEYEEDYSPEDSGEEYKTQAKVIDDGGDGPHSNTRSQSKLRKMTGSTSKKVLPKNMKERLLKRISKSRYEKSRRGKEMNAAEILTEESSDDELGTENSSGEEENNGEPRASTASVQILREAVKPIIELITEIVRKC